MDNNPANILVVDDDEYTLELIKATLEDSGYSVSLASNGRSALDLLGGRKPDLVILDLKLPGISGFDVLKQIRRITGTPVIILTGVMDIDSLTYCLDLGANDYIKKPFQNAELVARVKAKLRRATLQPGNH